MLGMGIVEFNVPLDTNMLSRVLVKIWESSKVDKMIMMKMNN